MSDKRSFERPSKSWRTTARNHFKESVESLAPRTQIIKRWGVAEDFCTALNTKNVSHLLNSWSLTQTGSCSRWTTPSKAADLQQNDWNAAGPSSNAVNKRSKIPSQWCETSHKGKQFLQVVTATATESLTVDSVFHSTAESCKNRFNQKCKRSPAEWLKGLKSAVWNTNQRLECQFGDKVSDNCVKLSNELHFSSHRAGGPVMADVKDCRVFSWKRVSKSWRLTAIHKTQQYCSGI